MPILIEYDKYVLFVFFILRYTVVAVAQNALGNVTSEILVVQSVKLISDLVTLQTEGIPVIHHSLSFIAKHFTGSDVTYSWNFGDNVTLKTKQRDVKHTYTK